VRFRLVCVGHPKAPLAAGIDAYERRAARYWPLDVREVKEGRADAADAVRRLEGGRLLAAADGARVVACTEDGEALDSRAFAAWCTQLHEGGRDVAFVIGGAHGLDDAVRAAAERRLRLAPFTMPHDLARLVLVEQLYRAGTLRRGAPYHK
jgi:23S rRNA (pseudouridine1915-N3)-methyltransferase